MTTVAALVDSNRTIHMWADTCVSYGETLIAGSIKKIRRISARTKPTKAERKAGALPVDLGQVLIAGSGDVALVSAVASHLRIAGVPDGSDTEDDWQGWAQAIAEALTQLGNQHARGQEGTHLIGCAGRLWWTSPYSANRLPGYGAIGSGSDFAWGALDAGHHLDAETPENLLRLAMDTATIRDPWTGISPGGDYQIERLDHPSRP